jgi:hypothetical protein
MTRAEKIQAAIDALPNATGGEWAISHSPNYGGEHFFEGPDGEEYEVGPALLGGSTEDSVARAADATLISAARELAEEVVRLRWLAEGAYISGWNTARFFPEKHFTASIAWEASSVRGDILKGSLGDQIVDAVSRQSGIPRVELIKPIPKGSGDNALGPAAYARRLARHPKKRGEEPPMGQYDEEPL